MEKAPALAGAFVVVRCAIWRQREQVSRCRAMMIRRSCVVVAAMPFGDEALMENCFHRVHRCRAQQPTRMARRAAAWSSHQRGHVAQTWTTLPAVQAAESVNAFPYYRVA